MSRRCQQACQPPTPILPGMTTRGRPHDRQLTPAERSLRSRIAAYSLHARSDPRETTRAARNAFLARFEQQVDPGRVWPERERLRRAEAARKAYFAGLALRSAKARRRRQRS